MVSAADSEQGCQGRDPPSIEQALELAALGWIEQFVAAAIPAQQVRRDRVGALGTARGLLPHPGDAARVLRTGHE